MILLRQLVLPFVIFAALAAGSEWALGKGKRDNRKLIITLAPLLLAAVLFWRARPPGWGGLAREILFVAVFSLLNFFVFRRLECVLSSGRWIFLPAILLSTLFALIYLRGKGLLALPVGIWAGLIFISSFFFVLEWILTGILPRRRRLWVAAALVLTLGCGLAGFINARRPPEVRSLILPIRGLPAAAANFTIVQLSDMHLGGVETKDWLRRTVRRVNNLRADLIVITGDLFSRDPGPEVIEILKQLRARSGVIAVPGNHEFYLDVDRCSRLAAAAGIRMLRNERIDLDCGIQLAGFDDDAAKHFHRIGPDPEKAFSGVDPSRPLILLYHQPSSKPWLGRWRVDLQLSGHTHAGQFPPIFFMVRLRFPYFRGLYSVDHAFIYTSAGTGVWAVPMRILSKNEITRIELVSK